MWKKTIVKIIPTEGRILFYVWPSSKTLHFTKTTICDSLEEAQNQSPSL